MRIQSGQVEREKEVKRLRASTTAKHYQHRRDMQTDLGCDKCMEDVANDAPQLPYLGPWCCPDGQREQRPICDGCRNILDLYNMEGIESVKVLSLREGDTLVVRCTDDIDWETAQRLRDMVKAIAKWEKVLVLGPQLQVEVLRPE
jgi:hypothetical protein